MTYGKESNMENMDIRFPPLESITKEEEALLVEYGTSGHYDDLLSFPAPSTCVFGYGGRDVFLTGTTQEDDELNIVNKKDRAAGALNVDSTWPLECVLLRHTGMLSFATAEPLWDGVREVLNDTANPDLSVAPRDVLSTGHSDDVAAEAKVHLKSYLSLHDGSDEELLENLDGLLREADEVLARRRRYADPMSEACLLERQRAAAEEEQRWSPIHSDDNAATEVSALTDTDSDLEEEGHRDGEVRSLFAYEFGPTLEEECAMLEWDKAVERCEWQLENSVRNIVSNKMDDIHPSDCVDTIREALRLPSLWAEEHESSVAPTKPLRVEQCSNILDSIAMMEVRDSELQETSCQQLEELRQERRRPRCVPPDQLVFERFLTRVDALLPPNEAEVELRATAAIEAEEKVEIVTDVDEQQQPSARAEEKCRRTLSVEQIQKKAQRDCFRVRCEAHEAWYMQEEDNKTICELQWQKEQVRLVEDAIRKCLLEESNLYETLLAEENIAYQRLGDLKQQHASMIRRKEEENIQRAQAFSRLVHSLLEEHADTRRDIMDLEEDAVRELVREEYLARELLLVYRKRRIEDILGNVEQFKSMVRTTNHRTQREVAEKIALQETTRAWKRLDTSCQITTVQRRVVASSAGCTLRWRALLREESLRIEWLKGCKHGISNTVVLLEKFLGDVDEDDGRPPMPGSRPGVAAAASALPSDDPSVLLVDAGICLDASLARQLLPLIFGGAKSDLRELAQLCHTVSFALEQIVSVDFASLATLEVRTDGAAFRLGKNTTPATPLVRELDLGGNSLTKLPLDDILRVFPSLRTLNISDNKLNSLTCRAASMRGVSEAHAHSVAQATRLSRLNVSMNELQNIEAIGKLLSYNLRRLVIYANHIESLLPLAPCSQLECLEASRNKVVSLAELKHLLLLQTLDLSENLITVWDSLADHILLQNLYLSRNQIQMFPKTLSLGFLRQLFLNGNCIEEIPDGCFRWVPLLTVLRVENNKLRSVSGLANCTRLTDVGLAFNQLQRIEDLLPLTASKRLQTLSVSENPFFSDHEDTRITQKRMKNIILTWFPRLCELNNEKVTGDEQKNAVQEQTVRLWSFCVARGLMQQYHEGAVPFVSFWPHYTVSEDVQQVCSTMEFHSRYRNQSDAYADMFASITSDVSLTLIQKEQDILATICRRRYNDALYVEEALQQRMCDSKQRLNPVVHRLSDKIEKRNWRETTLTLRRHLTFLQTMPRVRANMHIRPVLFHERAQAHREARAKNLICEWVYVQLLGRRARKELKARRAAHAAERQKRYEAAARVIQPVWRGAALRSRLKRILHPTGNDEDDEEEFKHVSLDFIDGSEGAGGGDGVDTLLQRVLQAHGALPNFPVAPSPARVLGVNVSSEFFAPPRPSSATTYLVSRSEAHDKQRPDSQPVQLLQQDQQGQNPPLSSVGVDDEWSVLVSSQLRKRQKKMERSQREKMRREFMKDPLRVKRDIGGGGL